MVKDSVLPIWRYSGEEEISLKQIYAHLFNYFGFTHYREQDISLKDNFVGSDYSAKRFINGNFDNMLLHMEYNPRENYGVVISSSLKYIYRACGGFEAVLRRARTQDLFGLEEIFPRGDFHKSLRKMDQLTIFVGMIVSLKNDTFDSMLGNFFKANKYKVDDTLEKYSKALTWRVRTFPVDTLSFDGDTEVFDNSPNSPLIGAFKTNQAYIKGTDRWQNPLVLMRVKEHFRKNCPDGDFEKYMILIVSWAIMLQAPIQKGTSSFSILFDMLGFTMRNVNFAALKFLISNFEDNFPESIAHIFIHNAPWIFNAVWKIIKGWMPPELVQRIHFTFSVGELNEFVDLKHIPQDLGGESVYEGIYVEPSQLNSGLLPKDNTYRKLLKERTFLVVCLFQATIDWLESKTIQESDRLLEVRFKLGVQLARNYNLMDPYLRRKGVFERAGVIECFTGF